MPMKKQIQIKNLLLSIFLLSLLNSVHSQDKVSQLDSLHDRLSKQAITTKDVLLTKVALANYYVYHNLDSAKLYIDAVLLHPKLKTSLPKGYCMHLMVKAWTFHGNMEMDSAKVYYLKAKNIAFKEGDRKSQTEVFMNLGAFYEQTRDTQAMTFVKNYLSVIDTAQGNDDKIAYILGQQYLGRIHGFKKQYNRAIPILIAAMKIPFIDDFPEYQLGVFKSLGTFLGEIGDFEMSKKYLEQALALETLHPYETKMLLDQLAKLYLSTDSLSRTKYYLDKIPFYGKMSLPECHKYNRLYARLNLRQKNPKRALLYLQDAKICAMDMQDQEILIKDKILEAYISTHLTKLKTSNQLLNNANQMLNLSPNLNSLDIEHDIALVKFSNKLLQSDNQLLSFFDQYIQSQKRLNRFSSSKRLKELTIQYETELKEQENKILKNENALKIKELESQRLYKLLLSVLLFASLIIAYILYRYYKVEQKNKELIVEEKEELIFEKKALVSINQQLKSEVVTIKKELASITNNESIKIISYDKTYRVHPMDIMYLKPEKEGWRFYLKEGKSHYSKTTLKQILKILPTSIFIQIHRFTVVNKAFIECIYSSSLVIQGGISLDIGRRYRDNFTQKTSE